MLHVRSKRTFEARENLEALLEAGHAWKAMDEKAGLVNYRWDGWLGCYFWIHDGDGMI